MSTAFKTSATPTPFETDQYGNLGPSIDAPEVVGLALTPGESAGVRQAKLKIRREVLDRIINMREAEGKIMRAISGAAAMRERLETEAGELTDAQALDIRGRLALFEAAAAASHWKLIHWRLEVEELTALFHNYKGPGLLRRLFAKG